MLRVRADDGLRDLIRPPDGTNGGGEFLIPSRERVSVGERVSIEVSFGVHADEIFVEGVVTTVQHRDAAAPLVTVNVLEAELLRMKYMVAVLEGQREATARRFRRVDAALDVRWWWGIKAHLQRARGISVGGTFIHSAQAPQVGFQTEVEVRTDTRKPPLRIPARVAWAGDNGHGHGFGVQFQVGDARVADGLHELVKFHERSSSREIMTLLRR